MGSGSLIVIRCIAVQCFVDLWCGELRHAPMLTSVIKRVNGEHRHMESRKRSVLLIDSHLCIYFFVANSLLNVV